MSSESLNSPLTIHPSPLYLYTVYPSFSSFLNLPTSLPVSWCPVPVASSPLPLHIRNVSLSFIIIYSPFKELLLFPVAGNLYLKIPQDSYFFSYLPRYRSGCKDGNNLAYVSSVIFTFFNIFFQSQNLQKTTPFSKADTNVRRKRLPAKRNIKIVKTNS